MPRQRPEDWRQQLGLDQLERDYALPSGLLTAIVERESNGNPNAFNQKSEAAGLFQFIPRTAAAYNIDPYDPPQAARAAAQELASLYKKYGDLPRTIAGWNWGQGRLDRLGLERAPKETRDFIAFAQERVGEDLSELVAQSLQPRGLQVLGETLGPASVEAASGGTPQGEDLSGLIANQLANRDDALPARSAPPAATVPVRHGMDDKAIAEAFGYDYDVIRQSKYYRPGMLQSRVTDPTSRLARTMDSVLGGLVRGIRDPIDAGNQLFQRGLRVIGIGSDADVALADLTTKLAEADYQQNIRQGRNLNAATGQGRVEVSRIAGNIAVPSPGSIVARGLVRGGSVLASAARGLLSGAGAALDTPVENPERGGFATQKMVQAATGAVAGGVLGPVAEQIVAPGAQRTINATRGVLRQGYEGILDLGERYGVRLSAGDITQNPSIQRQEVLLESVPGIGLSAYRSGQQREAANAAQRVRDQLATTLRVRQYRNLTAIEQAAQGGGERARQAQLLIEELRQAGDDWTQIIQSSGKLNLFANRLHSDALYDRVEQLAEPLGATMRLPNTVNALDAALGEARAAIIPDMSTITVLQRIRDRLVRTLENPTQTANILEETQPLTYAQARTLRSDLGQLVDGTYTGRETLTGYKASRLLQQVKSGVESDLLEFAQTSGIPELTRAARIADRYYRHAVVPYKDTALANALKNLEPDQVYGKFIKQATTPDKATTFYRSLDPRGRAAVRLGMVEEALDAATQTTRGDFSPTKFAQYLERIRDSYQVFFRGPERAELDGFVNLMRHIERAGQFAENPPTGQRLANLLFVTATGGGVFAAPGTTAASLTLTLGARELFTSTAGRRLLIAASRLPEDAPQWQRIIDTAMREIPRLAARVATEQQSPSTENARP